MYWCVVYNNNIYICMQMLFMYILSILRLQKCSAHHGMKMLLVRYWLHFITVAFQLQVPSLIFYKDGNGNWTNSGCSTSGPSSDGIITCSCNHLANFALLVVSTVACICSIANHLVIGPSCRALSH